MMPAELLRAKEFAERCGVSVRTLHLYDRLGLLPPAQRTPNGYRWYGRKELERLQQIVALRFVGFTLERIPELLSGGKFPLLVSLRMQREILRRRRDALSSAERAIDAAETALCDGSEDELWKAFRTLIEVMTMERHDNDWMKKYYSAEAQAVIEARAAELGPDGIAAGERAWTTLLAEVEEAALHDDPASDRAAELARRWVALVREFTGGHAGVRDGLNEFYADAQNGANGFRRPWSDHAETFIRAAMRSAGIGC